MQRSLTFIGVSNEDPAEASKQLPFPDTPLPNIRTSRLNPTGDISLFSNVKPYSGWRLSDGGTPPAPKRTVEAPQVRPKFEDEDIGPLAPLPIPEKKQVLGKRTGALIGRSGAPIKRSDASKENSVPTIAETEDANPISGTEQTRNEKQQHKRKRQRKALQKSLWVVFVLDITGSMQPFVELARQTVLGFVAKTHAMNPNAIVKVAFICYSDFGTYIQFRIRHFTSSLDNVEDFLDTISAIGGDDEAEDSLGALCMLPRVFKSLSKKGKGKDERLIVWFGDAPHHAGSPPKEPRSNYDSYPTWEAYHKMSYKTYGMKPTFEGIKAILEECKVDKLLLFKVKDTVKEFIDTMTDLMPGVAECVDIMGTVAEANKLAYQPRGLRSITSTTSTTSFVSLAKEETTTAPARTATGSPGDRAFARSVSGAVVKELLRSTSGASNRSASTV